MPKYKVNRRVRCGGLHYPGDVIDLNLGVAAALLDCGAVSEVSEDFATEKTVEADDIEKTPIEVPLGTESPVIAGEVDDQVAYDAALDSGAIAEVKPDEKTPESAKTLNLNTASKTGLVALPGVGPVTAEKLLTARPFDSLAQAQVTSGMSDDAWAKVADEVTV